MLWSISDQLTWTEFEEGVCTEVEYCSKKGGDLMASSIKIHRILAIKHYNELRSQD